MMPMPPPEVTNIFDMSQQDLPPIILLMAEADITVFLNNVRTLFTAVAVSSHQPCRGMPGTTLFSSSPTVESSQWATMGGGRGGGAAPVLAAAHSTRGYQEPFSVRMYNNGGYLMSPVSSTCRNLSRWLLTRWTFLLVRTCFSFYISLYFYLAWNRLGRSHFFRTRCCQRASTTMNASISCGLRDIEDKLLRIL